MKKDSLKIDKSHCINCGKKLGIFGNISLNLFEIIPFKLKYGFIPHFCSFKCKTKWLGYFKLLKKIQEEHPEMKIPNNLDFKNKEIEFKRTCKHCKKTWFVSLKEMAELSEELKIQKFKDKGVTFAAPALSGSTGVASTTLRKQLNDLGKCPNCQSTNYKETYVSNS